MIKALVIVSCVFLLQGCITKIVTVPVKVAYKTTKGVVKGTAAVVGAVIGIGLLKGGKEVQWGIAGRITIGWFTLPIIAAIISMFLLFILQNIFNLTVSF